MTPPPGGTAPTDTEVDITIDEDDLGETDTGGGVLPGAGGIGESQVPEKIVSMLEEHCAECHHAGTFIDFTSTPMKSSFANQKALLKKVVEVSGPSGTMPPQPRTKLSADDLAVIKAFIE